MPDELNPDQWRILQDEPVDFIELAFGDSMWEIPQRIANSVRDHTYTVVRSCHGASKSHTAARLALWFLYSFANSKVITTAPTWNQVENILWREIRSAKSRSRITLGGKHNLTDIDLGPDWFAMGLSTNEPDRMQGFHAISVLLIVDEASGVAEDIFNASEGIVSSEHARVLYIGNPTNTGGTFAKSFKLPGYSKIHISAFDTPNFTHFGITLEDIRQNTWQQKITGELPRPYLITPEWVYDKYLRWGEGNPMWDSRVLGNFPEQGEDTLIPLIRIEEAARRSLVPLPTDPERIGVDVARHGADKTNFLYRKGPKVLDSKAFSQLDTMQTTQKLRDYATERPEAEVAIDTVGIGAGVYDRLVQLLPERRIHEVNVGEKPYDTEQFVNLRAEIYWALRERFISGDIDLSELPPDVLDELMGQLAQIKFRYTTKGQVQIESKEDMKKRGMASPDQADSLAIAYGRLKGQVNFFSIDTTPAKPALPQIAPPAAVDEEKRRALERQADLDLIKQQRGW